MTDDEDVFVVCVVWDERVPSVKCVKEACSDCGAEVAISDAVRREMLARHGAYKALCMSCALPVPDDQEVRIPLSAKREIAAYSAWRRMQGQ